jgi:hypothetical protein
MANPGSHWPNRFTERLNLMDRAIMDAFLGLPRIEVSTFGRAVSHGPVQSPFTPFAPPAPYHTPPVCPLDEPNRPTDRMLLRMRGIRRLFDPFTNASGQVFGREIEQSRGIGPTYWVGQTMAVVKLESDDLDNFAHVMAGHFEPGYEEDEDDDGSF